jgi:hypothetical protein
MVLLCLLEILGCSRHFAEMARTSIELVSASNDEGSGMIVQNRNSIHDLKSVPNGGFLAWLQVLGGFLLLFNTW